VRPQAGNGFGLGFLVRTVDGRSPVAGAVGDISWPGIFGTYFWVDPKNDFFAILMMQVPPAAGPTRVKYWTETRRLVYAALQN
jgi:CubicO group peptidase (beta-lactamase class C family)